MWISHCHHHHLSHYHHHHVIRCHHHKISFSMETIIIKCGFKEKKKKAAQFRTMFVAWKLPVKMEENLFIFVSICLKTYSIIVKKLIGGHIFCGECDGREGWESRCHCTVMCRSKYNFWSMCMQYLFKNDINRNMFSCSITEQMKPNFAFIQQGLYKQYLKATLEL